MRQRDVNTIRMLAWRWPLVGLLLSVTFLAHDVAMAGEAHRVGTTRPHIVQPHPHFDTSRPSHSSTYPHDEPSSEGPCSVKRDAAPTSDGGSRLPPTADQVNPLMLDRDATPVPPWATEPPTLPPEVRRALLQVFLI
ncbi:MAG: hypothetical protein ACRDJW_11235 [Thermomicrobiales bacterium]